MQLPGAANFTVFGEVTGVHIRGDTLRDGRFDVMSFGPMARLGYKDYTRVETLFSLERPDD